MTTETKQETSTEDFDPASFDPEKLPTDPGEFAEYVASLATGESGKPDDEAKGEKPEAQQQDAKDQPEAKDEGKPQTGEPPDSGERKPQGIATRDGKHIIPYAVLEATRQREQEALRQAEEARRLAEEQKRLAEEAMARLRELESASKRGDTASPSEGTDGSVVSKLEAANRAMEKLAEEAPELAETLKPLIEANLSSIQRIETLQQEIAALRARSEQDEAREIAERKTEVQQAVERNPYLLYWQNEDPETFNRAAAIDKVLREDPANAHLSLDERFAKVVTMVHAAYGKTELPEKYRPHDRPQGGTPEPDRSGDIEARAKERIEKASGVKPMTLSDMPGGAPPVSGDRRIEEMSAAEIAARIDAVLEKGGSLDDILRQFGA